ncbi:MAG: hypothetical protein ACXVXU_13410 [Blastococcus sp.]
MGMRAAVLCTLVVALVAGCAQNTPAVREAGAPPSIAAQPSYGPISQAEACPSAAPVHLPADVGLVTAAYVCVKQFRTVPGDGQWEFAVVQAATSGLEALVLAYGTPDAPPTDGACAAIGYDPLIVYLHGGRTVAVRAPQDGCGKPTAAAMRAFAALGTVDITARRVRQVTSQLSLTSGCSDQYKDMLAIEEESGGPRHVWRAPRPVGAGAELCVYRVTADAQGIRLGQLASARRLTPADLDRIDTALTTATADTSCTRHQHTRFALLQGGRGGFETLVAVDGCAVQQDGGWCRAPDRLRALVAA